MASSDPAIETFVATIIQKHPRKTGQLLGVINDIQCSFRYVPREVLAVVGSQTGSTVERLEHFCSLLKNYSTEPIGIYLIEVCDGTACHAVGALKLLNTLEEHLGIKAGTTSDDGRITLRKVHCIGACGLAPAVVVDGSVQGRVKLSSVAALTDSLVGV